MTPSKIDSIEIKKEELVFSSKELEQKHELEKIKTVLKYVIEDNEDKKIVKESVDNITTTYYNDYIDIDICVIPENITEESDINIIRIDITDCFHDYKMRLREEKLEDLLEKIMEDKQIENFYKRLKELSYSLDISKENDLLIIKNKNGGRKSFKQEEIKEAFCEVIISDSQVCKIDSKRRNKKEQVSMDTDSTYPGCIECSVIEEKENISFPFVDSNLKICHDCYEDFLIKYTNYTEGEIIARKI